MFLTCVRFFVTLSYSVTILCYPLYKSFLLSIQTLSPSVQVCWPLLTLCESPTSLFSPQYWPSYNLSLTLLTTQDLHFILTQASVWITMSTSLDQNVPQSRSQCASLNQNVLQSRSQCHQYQSECAPVQMSTASSPHQNVSLTSSLPQKSLQSHKRSS